MGTVTIGIDVGQRADPTAVAVVEMQWRGPEDRRADHYLCRHLSRLPLGTEYPQVAERLGDIVAGARQYEGSVRAVYLDATGVGQPVADELKSAGVRVTPVYFTHGDRRKENEDGSITLGKAFLVSRLKVLMQSKRIHLARTEEMDAMQRELMDYEIRVNEHANETYGAFKTGAHDDLVTALGLAVQEKPQTVRVTFFDLDAPEERGNWQRLPSTTPG